MPRQFTVIDAEQRSAAWFTARAGRLTASAAKDIFAFNKDKKESAARRDLRMRLVCERLSGRPLEDDYQNADMRRGIELEPRARTCYMSETGETVNQCGFVAHNEHPIGCSPDGIVGDFVGGVELKCPRPANHLAYLRLGLTLPAEYEPQILHSLWVTNAEYWDFVSFCDAFPESLQLFVYRVKRNNAAVRAYAEEALRFLAEVETEYQAVRTMANPAETLREAAGLRGMS